MLLECFPSERLKDKDGESREKSVLMKKHSQMLTRDDREDETMKRQTNRWIDKQQDAVFRRRSSNILLLSIPELLGVSLLSLHSPEETINPK